MTTLTFTVEAAFGADLTVAPASWSWTDITRYVNGSIQVRRGRQIGATQTDAAQCDLRLNNTDSRFTPRHPLGAYYPNVNLNTPIRIKLNPGTGAVIRFQGYMSSIAPYWPAGNSEYAEVAISAKGVIWRLNQGRTLRSPLVRAIAGQFPLAAWALEDNSGASSAASLISGGRPLVLDGVTLGNSSDLAGTTFTADLPAGARLIGICPTSSVTGFVGVDVWFKAYTTSATATKVKLASINLMGDVYKVDLEIDNSTAYANGYLFTMYHGGSVDTSAASATALNPFDGQWHNAFFFLHQNGANINPRLYVDGVFVSPLVTVTSLTLGVPTSVVLQNKLLTGDSGTITMASAAIYNDSNATNSHSAGLGYAGETATDRITRLCGEENIDLNLVGSSTIAMGAQHTGTLIDLLRECEAADGGILSDGLSAGVKYLSRSSRENQAVTLALNAAIGQVKLPFEPVEDDQRLITREVATRRGGSSASYEDAAKETTAGIYESPTTVNVYSDDMLADQASWRVHLATVEEMRAPAVALNLLDRPELIAAWLASDVGLRYTVADPPEQYPPGMLDLTFEQLSEQCDAATWTADVAGSPFAPWRVFVVEDQTLGRLDTDGSRLTSSLTATATFATVEPTTGWPLWITTASRSGDFPFSAGLDGEQVTVTAISSPVTDAFGRTASSSWTTADTGGSYTSVGGAPSDYAVSGGQGTHTHTSVNVSRKTVIGSSTATMEAVVSASIPVVAAGAAIQAGVMGRYIDASNYYRASLVFNTDSTLDLSLIARVAGAETTLTTVRVGLYTVATLYRVWLRIVGTSLYGRAGPAAGNGPTWWQATATDPSLSSAGEVGCHSRLNTGNTNTLNVVISFDNFEQAAPQTCTLTRSVNAVVKAHSAGAGVALWRPPVLAL